MLGTSGHVSSRAGSTASSAGAARRRRLRHRQGRLRDGDGCQQRLINLEGPRGDRRPTQAFLGLLASLRRDVGSPRRVVEESPDCIRQRLGFSRRDENAVPPILKQLPKPTDVGGDDRATGGEGFVQRSALVNLVYVR